MEVWVIECEAIDGSWNILGFAHTKYGALGRIERMHSVDARRHWIGAHNYRARRYVPAESEE